MKNLFLLLTICIAFTFCKPVPTTTSTKPLIVCTTGIIGNMVTSLVDSLADVKSLMGPGVDPHLYKVTQGDLQLLTKADLIIYNGLHLEGKMGEILEKLGQSKNIFAVAEGIDQDLVINSSGFIGGHDPHIWFDVQLWLKATTYTKNQLLAWQPTWNTALEKSFIQTEKTLLALDTWTKTQIESIPEKKRMLVTAHDAFEYFSRAYGIEVKALQGISTMSEFGLKDVIDLVDFIKQHEIPAVFIESSVPVKSLEAVVEGCRSKGHNLVIGGSLYSDALGAANTPEGSYVGMVEHNVRVIVEGLTK